jgi:hypothetical protein
MDKWAELRTTYQVAKLGTVRARSMRNWATLYSEVELPIGSQDICEQGR